MQGESEGKDSFPKILLREDYFCFLNNTEPNMHTESCINLPEEDHSYSNKQTESNVFWGWFE